MAGPNLVGKATNWHHDRIICDWDCGLKLSMVMPVCYELSSLPIILSKVVTSLPQVDKRTIVFR